MGFARLPTLLLAAVLDGSALWHAFVLHDLDYTSALVRYLVAVVVAAFMLWLLRGLANGYLRGNDDAKAEAERAGGKQSGTEQSGTEPAGRGRRNGDDKT